MGNILGSWSGMRSYLEHEMLAPSLRGRVRYNCASYVGMDGFHAFELFIDGKLFKRFSWETVNKYFIASGMKEESEYVGELGFWDGYWALLDKTPPSKRTEYTDGEFCEALKLYRNQPITESIHSDDAIIKMFAVLDRRIGKRTLSSVAEDMSLQPDWLKTVYELRLRYEKL